MKLRQFLIQRRLLALIPAFCLSSCLYVDNQKIIPYDRSHAGNPKVLINSQTAKTNQEKHKILISIIDTGVDYNHPLLQNHIHFSFAKNQKITGAGYDFLANDAWPAPYIVRTDDNNSEITPNARSASKNIKQLLEKLQIQEPRLQRFLNPLRKVVNESAYPLYHGTHVAALAAANDTRIGILPFRALLENRGESNSALFRNIIESIDASVNQGARIINFSGGLTVDFTNASAKKIMQFNERVEMAKTAIQKHNNVLFVASLPNVNKRLDGSYQNIPCGSFEAENLLCVGYLSKNGTLGSDTARLENSRNLVYTKGEEIWSAAPMNICYHDFSFMLLAFIANDPVALSKYKHGCYRQELASEKSKLGNMVKATGASFATPRVANLAANIMLSNPELAPRQVIEEILQRTTNEYNAEHDFLFRALPLPDLSWQKTADEYFGSIR